MYCAGKLSSTDLPADVEMLDRWHCSTNYLYSHYTVTQQSTSTTVHRLDFHRPSCIKVLRNGSQRHVLQ